MLGSIIEGERRDRLLRAIRKPPAPAPSSSQTFSGTGEDMRELFESMPYATLVEVAIGLYDDCRRFRRALDEEQGIVR